MDQRSPRFLPGLGLGMGSGAQGGAAQSLKERDVAQAGPAQPAAWLALQKARLRVEDVGLFGRW